MASTYKRADSPFIWIRYKSDSGGWKSANTGYRQDNIGDRKQAKLLAKHKSQEEMANKPVRVAPHRWEDWGVSWISGRWGNRRPDSFAGRLQRPILVEDNAIAK